jgi:hypothetical protein
MAIINKIRIEYLITIYLYLIQNFLSIRNNKNYNEQYQKIEKKYMIQICLDHISKLAFK